MDLIVSPMAHAPQNLALEDLYAEKDASVLLVHRDSPCLSIGMGQALDKEVDLDAAMRMGVDFVQRKTGGGAVYRDEGCLCWSFVNTCGTRRSIVEWVISALASLGVVVAHNGRNDLLWERRKVAGTAWSSDEGRTVFHGTLLFSTDIGKMNRLLTPKRSRYPVAELASASSRVANLSRALPGVTVDTFQKEFVSALSTQMESDGMAVRRREPTDDEIEASATAAERFAIDPAAAFAMR